MMERTYKDKEPHHLPPCFPPEQSLGISTMTTETKTQSTSAQRLPEPKDQPQYPREPLQLKGVLDAFEYFDVTPVIGREFKNVNLAEWLRAPNSDELILDLAITSTVYQRTSENVHR
jgi:hypothetical protein